MRKTVGFFPHRPDLDRATFRDHYESVHAPLAMQWLHFDGYRRNHLVGMPILGFDCISEFWHKPGIDMMEVMAGPGGDLLRADELKFMDKPNNRAALATCLIEQPASPAVQLALIGGNGDAEALAAVVRVAGGGLDLLEPFDARPLPCDALVSLPPYAVLGPLPAGWTLIAHGQAERCVGPAE